MDDRMEIHFASHPSEEEWEDYAFGRVAPPKAEKLEVHLLACSQCQAILEQVEDFIHMMRSARPAAAVPMEAQPSASRWFSVLLRPHLGLALAAAAVLVAVGVGLESRSGRPEGPPVSIALASYRDGSTVTAPAGKPLELSFLMTEVPKGSYSGEVVELDGRRVWNGSATMEAGRARASVATGLSKGRYWVRLYGADHALVAEAGLSVQ